MTDLEETIVNVAEGPKSYENDGEKITNHSIPELIEADRYIRKKRAARNPWRAIKMVKMSTQGPER